MFIQIQWTTGTEEEAKKITKELLDLQLIACANILLRLKSLYIWEDQLQEEEEVKVFFKTKEEHFPAILHYIQEHGSYDVPEVSALPILSANPDYITWLNETVK
jgi:periplasmic divalent cation tolerance protein